MGINIPGFSDDIRGFPQYLKDQPEKMLIYMTIFWYDGSMGVSA
jgi:hypothetical protein